MNTYTIKAIDVKSFLDMNIIFKLNNILALKKFGTEDYQLCIKE